MSKQCVKCGYVRQASDTAPDYECPKCGVIYAKAESIAVQRSVQKKEPIEEKNAGSSIKDLPLPNIDSWRVVLYQNGSPVETKLKRLYATHGPFVIDDYRLDRLEKVEIVRDASTVTTHSTSEGETSTKTGSLATRAVVGNMIAGPAGMIVGAGSAKTNTVTKTVSNETINVNIYLSLTFRELSSPVTIQIFSEEGFQQIFSSQGQAEWSQPVLEAAKDESLIWATERYRRTKIREEAEKQGMLIFGGIFVVGVVFSIAFFPSFLGKAAGIIGTLFLGSIMNGAFVGNAIQKNTSSGVS